MSVTGPAGDECAAYSPAPLDVPMPPEVVAAMRSVPAARVVALDLDAIEASIERRRRRCDRCGAPACAACDMGGDCNAVRCANHADDSTMCEHSWLPFDFDAEDQLTALVARARELEAESAARLACADHVRDEIRAAAKSADVPGGDEAATAKRMANCVRRLRAQLAATEAEARTALDALHARIDAMEAQPADDAEADGTDAAHPAWWRGNDAGCAGSLALIAQLRAEVGALKAQVAAPQPAPLDFYGALAAVRNGRFVPTWGRCLACSGTGADVDGAPCEPCRGTGQQPPPLSDRDLCPKCGALDLDHACPKSAATVAGEAFAAEHPEAAGRILG